MRHVLPPLRSFGEVAGGEAVHGVTLRKQPGVWFSEEATVWLNELSDDIATEPSVEFNVLSIPHPWAHYIAFGQALRDSEHPWRKRVVAEWRGLLMLLALAPSADVDVKTLPFPE